MEKVCDCGILYAEHKRCAECWVLLHTDEKYCRIFNSEALIGFTTNNLRCWECVPGSNKKTPPTKRKRSNHIPLDETVPIKKGDRKEYYRAYRKKKYQEDSIFREKIKAESRAHSKNFNDKFLDKK